MDAFLTPDPNLPQLALATNIEAMRDLIATHFPLLREVTSCQLARIRYRRGERAILQYSVGHTWVTALAYPHTEMPRSWRKVQRQLQANPKLATHVVKLDDLDLVLQCFPFDWNLPTLGKATEMLPERLSHVMQGQITQIQPVRYRAGLGAVLRCDSTLGYSVFVKVFTENDAEKSLGLLRQLQTHTGLRTPSLIAFVTELNALVLEAAHGITLEQVLLRGDGLDAIRRVVHALANFHLDKRIGLNRQHTHEDEAADIHRTGVYLTEALPQEREAITHLVNQITAQLHPCDLAPTHRDLKPDHLFLDDEGVTVIDVDSCAMADPVCDVALLMARLLAMPFTHPITDANANAASDAFCKAYFASVPTAWLTRLPTALAGALLNVAASFCRRAEPNWCMAAQVLLAKAFTALESREVQRIASNRKNETADGDHSSR